MRASVVPDLIDAFVRNATEALAEVDLGGGEYATVYDGIGNSDNPGAYLMVGVDDEDPSASVDSASSEQDWATAGGSRSRDETGDISCVAYAWNGGGDDAQRLVREQVFAIANVLSDLCRSQDLSAGVDGVWSLSFTDTRLKQYLTAAGERETYLLFRIHFKARI